MKDVAERAVLMTVNARLDAAFPEELFVSLRLYDLDGDDPPTETVEVTSVEGALDVLGRWLQSFRSQV